MKKIIFKDYKNNKIYELKINEDYCLKDILNGIIKSPYKIYDADNDSFVSLDIKIKEYDFKDFKYLYIL